MSQANAVVVPSKQKRNLTRTDIQAYLLQARAFIALILVVAAFTILVDGFLAPANIIIIAKQVAVNAIMGIGMTFVILTAGIDLSVGSIVGLTAMIAGGLLTEGLVLPWFGPDGIIIFFN
ncbi:MAG: ABC transporter permease, partial [Anaerolineae bacterium]|nr:ABC transporter permease [Anaerolineae bacterium]